MARFLNKKALAAALLRGTAVLLVVLIGGLGYVQAVHVHQGLAAEQRSARAHCSICLVSHNAVQVTAVSSGPLPAMDTGRLATSDPQLRSRLFVSTASIRPPPFSL